MFISKLPKKSILAGFIITLTALGHTANAAVVLLNEYRSVSAGASISTPSGSDNASTSRNSLGDFADFNKSVDIDLSLEDASAQGAAQQNSQISTTSIMAAGAVDANAEVTTIDQNYYYTSANANGSTSLSIDFQVDTPQLFDLSGFVSSSIYSGYSSGYAEVSLRSQDGSFEISFRTPYWDGNTTPFDLSGTLFPNIYTLRANADIGANAYYEEAVGGAAEFYLEFDVAAVPIPATVWLFGSGLIGLVGIARRKQANRV